MVGGLALVGQAEHVLDDPVVRDAQPEGEAALADGLGGQRLLGQHDRDAGAGSARSAVPISILDVAAPISVAAVMTSNSSGICGVQTESRPASSAQRASAWSFSTLVA